MKSLGNQESTGFMYGLLGIIGFSLTLPATKIAVSAFDPMVVGVGRALPAAVIAGIVLLVGKQRLPRREEIRSLCMVVLGVIIGFPYLSSWAMERVPVSHGAIVNAMLPLATAGAAAIFARERPSRGFWLASAAACAAVLGFSFREGSGGFQLADLALGGAVVSAAIGYAEGAKLTRTMGSWQVISWALVFSFPVLLIPVTVQLHADMLAAPLDVWLSFGYVSLISQFVAFIAWYRGLAVGGVARVSQIQYLQPFFTMAASALLLSENITPSTIVVAMIVLAAVAAGKRSAVQVSLSGKNG